jgi:hypothetical protein
MPKWYDSSGASVNRPITAGERQNGIKQAQVPILGPALVSPPPARRTSPARTDIAVISCYYNPSGTKNLRRNFDLFYDDIRRSGIPIYVAEGILPGQKPTIHHDGTIHIPVKERFMHKENLLNHAARIVPAQFTKLAFVDCDFIWREKDWAWQASELLDHLPAVQCWSYMNDFAPDLKTFTRQHSASMAQEWCVLNPSDPAKQPQRGKGRPGGGWAVHREIFTRFGGLYDKMITGGGDAVHTFGAFQGFWDIWFFEQYNTEFVDDMKRWGEPLHRYVRGNIGVIDAQVDHLFHGTRADRQYAYRSKIVIGIDPATELVHDSAGTLVWNTDKKQVIREMENYFADRNEDGNGTDLKAKIDMT